MFVRVIFGRFSDGYKFTFRLYLFLCFFLFLDSTLAQKTIEQEFYNSRNVYGIQRYYSQGVGYFYSGLSTLAVGRTSDGATNYLGYIEFDFSSIPTDAVVNSVLLHLTPEPNNRGDIDFRLLPSPLSDYNYGHDGWSEIMGASVFFTTVFSGYGVDIKLDKLREEIQSIVASNYMGGIQFGMVRDPNSIYNSTWFNVSSSQLYLKINYTLPVPNTPSKLSVISVGELGCSLSWEKPSGNTKVDGYCIYKDGEYLLTTSTTKIEIDNLSSATRYNFRVSAYNSRGESTMSNTVNVLTIPSVPKNLVHNHIGCGQYEVLWTSSDFSENGVEYFVFIDNVEFGSTTSGKLVLEGLDDYKTYMVKVKAINASGESSFSSSMSFQTVSSMQPAAPTSPRIFKIPVAGAGYQLSWKDENNGTIDFYTIIERSPNSGLVANTKNTSVYLNYLDDYKMYIYTVQAVKDMCASEQLTWGFHTGYLKSIGINDEFQDVQMVDIETLAEILVTPNPVRDLLSINGFSEFSFEIYSINGVLKYNGYSSDGIVNVSNLYSGIYLLRLLKGDELRYFKFVKR